MTQCKSCLRAIVDIMAGIKEQNFDKAIHHAELLLTILKTYKGSC